MSVSNNDIREVKSDLRSGFKHKRSDMPENVKLNMDCVFTYVSKELEVDTFAIIRAAWANGKKVAVPKCVSNNQLDFYYIESMDDLEEGTFGVKEPIAERCQKVTDLSKGLCIVPGLSFDAEGYRLGYGKGYYDRFLSKFGGDTVGLCYSNCIKWKLPHGKYDRAVDVIVTDRYIRRTNIQ